MRTEAKKRPEAGKTRGGIDLAGTLSAMVFIVLACLALWDTTSMTDSDSYVFPWAIAAAMIVFCVLLIVYNLTRVAVGAGDAEGPESSLNHGSMPRRVGLVAAMLGPALAMPWTGFLLSGIIAFGAIMLLAMYDPWTGRRRIVFPLAGLAIVLGFYTLFSKVLLVPLPVGIWFR